MVDSIFKSLAGINIVIVAYKGSPATITALLTGEGQLTFGDGSPITTHLASGRLKGLAVTSVKPSALFPGLPTVANAVPGYEMVAIMGAFAPVKTPAAAVSRLNREIVRVLNAEDVKAKVFSTGSEVVTSSPEELGAWVKSAMARWGKVVQDARIKGE